MKNNLHVNPLLIKMFLIAACFMTVMLYNQSKAAGVPSESSNSRVAVNFKHNTERNELTISVKSNTETVMQLFIFTVDGILMNEVAVSAQTVTTIPGLKKGIYYYECFDNDRRMKSGNLLIK